MDTSMTQPKILFFDLETAPMTAYVWGLFKQFVGLNQIISAPRVICWSARWYGDKTVQFDSEYESDHTVMLTGIRDLLDEADVVVGYNSDGFDIPWLNEQFLVHGIELPSPYTQVDLYKLNKRFLYLPSRKLEHMAHHFLGDRKESTGGMQLWIDCIDGDDATRKKAWATMKKYAKKDTQLLEPLFDMMRPYIRNVNFGLYADRDFVCTHCGSENLQARGFAYTTAGKFQRYQCTDCGCWSKDPKRIETTELRPLVNN